MTTLCRAVLASMAFWAGSAAHAVPITFDFTGETTFADPALNDFGLTVGSTISGSAFIPDADIIGAQTYSAGAGGLDLVFNVGNFSFASAQDSGFPDFPTLDILDGQFVGLDFFVFDLQFLFSAFAGQWDATQFDSSFEPVANLGGTFGLARVTVPEPGTLSLLLAGFLVVGFVTIRQRVDCFTDPTPQGSRRDC